MESTVHKVDPNGDTLLILRNPNAPFAGDATVWPNALPKYRPDKLRRNERELKLFAQAKLTIPDSLQEVHFQLSSKHLTLTSEYFRGLMAHNWREASSSRGFAYSVTAEDWDEDALLLVMNIIHCQTSEVPQSIESHMVAKITCIVDYYQCREAFNFYARTWAKNFDARELTYCGYGRTLLFRLFISYFFINGIDFQLCTQIIVRESRGPIHSLGLPFPQNIIDALESERKHTVSTIITKLHTMVEKFREGSETCSYECSSASVGALVKTMKEMNLFEPRPAPPFAGYSYEAIERGLLKIQKPNYALISISTHKHHLYGCDIESQIRGLFRWPFSGIPGLDLGEYVNVSRKT